MHHISDYRSKKTGLYSRKSRPICTYQDFISSELNRKKYWLRNFISFPKVVSSFPNGTHATLSEWERNGMVSYIITQNIDRFLNVFLQNVAFLIIIHISVRKNYS